MPLNSCGSPADEFPTPDDLPFEGAALHCKRWEDPPAPYMLKDAQTGATMQWPEFGRLLYRIEQTRPWVQYYIQHLEPHLDKAQRRTGRQLPETPQSLRDYCTTFTILYDALEGKKRLSLAKGKRALKKEEEDLSHLHSVIRGIEITEEEMQMYATSAERKAVLEAYARGTLELCYLPQEAAAAAAQ